MCVREGDLNESGRNADRNMDKETKLKNRERFRLEIS